MTVAGLKSASAFNPELYCYVAVDSSAVIITVDCSPRMCYFPKANEVIRKIMLIAAMMRLL